MQTIFIQRLPVVLWRKLCQQTCSCCIRKYVCLSSQISNAIDTNLLKNVGFTTDYGSNFHVPLHTSSSVQIDWRLGMQKVMGVGPYSKARLALVGCKMYISCVDKIKLEEFFKYFKLEDTFFSWFKVTELHVWMVLVRVMHEERKKAVAVRRSLLESFWKDVEARAKKLGPMDVSYRRQSLDELNQQFNSALFSYDEGLLTDDRVLAGAVWRIFFDYKCDNAQLLETLVAYIRRTIYHLDSHDSETVLINGAVSWLPLINETGS